MAFILRNLMNNIVGNVYDKYNSNNPITQLLMRGFLNGITELYNFIEPASVLEVGCGEGALANYLLQHSLKRPQCFEASDLSLDMISAENDPLIKFRESSIYELPYSENSFDLVVCSEVLEHLEHPQSGLAEIARVAEKGVLLSAPWEPVWRVLNLIRGKYIGDLGNTPGHIQHFSRKGLINLVQTHLKIAKKRTPLPWTILLGVP
jgi:ubiquinone/menaquinone biosynthesis C-methylase UbiE